MFCHIFHYLKNERGNGLCIKFLTIFFNFLYNFNFDFLELPVCLAASERTSHLKVFGWSGPSCDKDGYFSPLQCPFKTGCYCVDQYGEATTKVSRDISSVQDCKKFIQNTKQPTTEVQPTTAGMKTHSIIPPNFFICVTHLRINWQSAQCWICVHDIPQHSITFHFATSFPASLAPLGSREKKLGTKLSILVLLMCFCYANFSLEFPPCWETVNDMKARFGGNFPQNFDGPNCDKDGYYAPLQCYPSTGCFCTDKYGAIKTGNFEDKSFIPDCSILIQVQPTTKGDDAFHMNP
jgi:hypothetical protein